MPVGISLPRLCGTGILPLVAGVDLEWGVEACRCRVLPLGAGIAKNEPREHAGAVRESCRWARESLKMGRGNMPVRRGNPAIGRGSR